MQNENIEPPSTISIRDNIKNFYNKNKLLVFSSLLILVIVFSVIFFYLQSKKNDKLFLANLYVQAKIDLSNKKREEAKNSLLTIINSNDKTYSPLSLFLIINANLIQNDEKLVELFDHVLSNNEFDQEVNNLIIFKKALIQSNFLDEKRLLESLKPIINSESLWRSHALLLLGDYFFSKGEFFKAKESYMKILSSTDLDNMHEQVRHRLTLGSND